MISPLQSMILGMILTVVVIIVNMMTIMIIVMERRTVQKGSLLLRTKVQGHGKRVHVRMLLLLAAETITA